MQLVKYKDTNRFSASASTTIFEYLMNESAINGAAAVIRGRYPEKGFATNTVSKELVLVLEGSGFIGFEDKKVAIEKDDVILLAPNEKYYWEGNLTLFMACTPAWKPEQHKLV